MAGADPRSVLNPAGFEMDADTWAAIQRGKDLTRELNLPLSVEEATVVYGPTDQRKLVVGPKDPSEVEDPDFGERSTVPEAIASNTEEYNEMREAWRMGQDLEAMLLWNPKKDPEAKESAPGWRVLRHIFAERVKELRREQDSYTGSNRNKILDLAISLRKAREEYDFIVNTIAELIQLKRPVLLVEEEK